MGQRTGSTKREAKRWSGAPILIRVVVVALLLCGAMREAAGATQVLQPPAYARRDAARAAARKPAMRSRSASGDLLDINTATAEQLKALPGMGPGYARRVIAGRPYTAKNQLATRGLVPQAVYDGMAGFIVAHRVAPK